jgi:DNA helicase INO80
MTEDTKPSKRKGWPSDHPTRVAQREAKEALLAAGMEVPKRKYKRKPKIATIEDELLGLAEGDEGRSSPAPPSEGIEADEDAQSVKGEREDLAPEEPVGPDSIVYPCGLTRAEVIRRVEKNDLRGLTETDVKAVQDEMWIRQFDPDALKGGMIRKDGTIRKKPGPAKGWKKMRRDLGLDGGSARGDDSDGESMSHAGETANGEADADIEALLEGDAAPERTTTSSSTKRGGKAKAKRRKLDEGDEVTRYASENDSRLGLDDEDDERRSSIVDGLEAGTGGKKHKSKAREPGVGKGKWTRPTKPEKDMLKKAEALAVQNVMQSAADTTAGTPEEVDASTAAAATAATAAGGQEAAVELVSQGPAPNTEDPRGVSEAEARVRLGLVEDLQRQAWQSIVRDIPRVRRFEPSDFRSSARSLMTNSQMYRVYQAYDSVVKQDSARKAQAAVRNAFSQRSMKPTFRSTARINKDAGTKARKVIKEVSAVSPSGSERNTTWMLDPLTWPDAPVLA